MLDCLHADQSFKFYKYVGRVGLEGRTGWKICTDFGTDNPFVAPQFHRPRRPGDGLGEGEDGDKSGEKGEGRPRHDRIPVEMWGYGAE